MTYRFIDYQKSSFNLNTPPSIETIRQRNWRNHRELKKNPLFNHSPVHHFQSRNKENCSQKFETYMKHYQQFAYKKRQYMQQLDDLDQLLEKLSDYSPKNIHPQKTYQANFTSRSLIRKGYRYITEDNDENEIFNSNSSKSLNLYTSPKNRRNKEKQMKKCFTRQAYLQIDTVQIENNQIEQPKEKQTLSRKTLKQKNIDNIIVAEKKQKYAFDFRISSPTNKLAPIPMKKKFEQPKKKKKYLSIFSQSINKTQKSK